MDYRNIFCIRHLTGIILLSVIDMTHGCSASNCWPSPEVLVLTIVICAAALAAILCPILCLFGPCKTKAIKWRIYLQDKLGWEYPETRNENDIQVQLEYGSRSNETTTHTGPVEYCNISFVDLPPSYNEVVQNSHLYKYGDSPNGGDRNNICTQNGDGNMPNINTQNGDGNMPNINTQSGENPNGDRNNIYTQNGDGNMPNINTQSGENPNGGDDGGNMPNINTLSGENPRGNDENNIDTQNGDNPRGNDENNIDTQNGDNPNGSDGNNINTQNDDNPNGSDGNIISTQNSDNS